MRRKRKTNVVSVWITIIFTLIAVTLVSLFLLVYHSILQAEVRTAIREQVNVLRDNADVQVVDVIQNEAVRRLAAKDAQTGFFTAMADGQQPSIEEITAMTAYFTQVKATIESCERVELYFPSSGIVIGSQGIQYLNDPKYAAGNSTLDYMCDLYPTDDQWVKRTAWDVGSERNYVTYLRFYPGVYAYGTEPMFAVTLEEAELLKLVRGSKRTLDEELSLLLVKPDGTVWAAEDAYAGLVGMSIDYTGHASNISILDDGRKVLIAEALSEETDWQYALIDGESRVVGDKAIVTVWAAFCVLLLLCGLVLVLRVKIKHYDAPIRRLISALPARHENDDKGAKLVSPVVHLLQIESALSDMNKLREEREHFMLHNKPLLRDSWLNCFIHGEAHYSVPQPQLEILFPHPHFQVVITSETPTAEELEIISGFFQDDAWVLETFESREKETVLLFNHAFDQQALPQMLAQAAEQLDQLESGLVFGVGVLSEGDEMVAASFRCARRALSMRYFEKDQRVCVFDPAARHAEAESSLSQIIARLTELASQIRRSPQEDVEQTIDSIVTQLRETTPYLNTMRSIMLLAAMFLSKMVYDMKGAPETVYGENLLNAYYHIQDISEFSMRLKQDCSLLRSYLTQETSSANRSVVQYAIHHIQNSEPSELSTHSIADAIGISTGHLSRMFHQETGRKLVDYLQEVRMEHAARLLREGELSNEEICEKIGYSRLQYFSGKFKEHYGLTLNDYRRQAQYGQDEA